MKKKEGRLLLQTVAKLCEKEKDKVIETWISNKIRTSLALPTDKSTDRQDHL